MARRVFFSFHYQNDIFRVNQIRNLGEIVGTAAAGFHDGSLWEEAKRKGDPVIQRMIDAGLQNTSVTVVCIGTYTAGRKFINYEINKSIERGNGILGLRINHLRTPHSVGGPPGDIPYGLTRIVAPIYTYTDHSSLSRWIEQAARAAGR